MNLKLILAAVVALGCVFAWDMSCKNTAESVVDEVYLNLGTLPDGNNRALLKHADDRIGGAYARTIVFNKAKIRRAVDMIKSQRSGLEHYLEELRTAPDGETGVAGIKSVAQTLRDLYAVDTVKFKHDLEYMRRGM